MHPDIAFVPAALPCAVLVVACLALAGTMHVAWLRSPRSRAFAVPIDGGRHWRGRPVFGANKTWRGLMAMPPAAAATFALAGLSRPLMPEGLAAGWWPLPSATLALVGAICGLAFMLAELPNSFLKRRLGVAPGQPAAGPWLRPLCFLIDRFDSAIGVLLALHLMLPLPAAAWGWALGIGAGLHWLFSVWLYHLRLKVRPG
ncbi:MAG: hypothetical protein KDH20_08950 [Rhodocyclaceae bacterium]|nr:hypothetical protein [Rhodocyclaceae bacterium]